MMMRSVLLPILLSTFIVCAVAGALPLLYAVFTGKFYEEVYAPPRSIKEFPARFLRFAIMQGLISAFGIFGLCRMFWQG